MNDVSEKNKISWNKGAAKYSTLMHSDRFLKRIIEEPTAAFHQTTWGLIKKYVPDLTGLNICVPSSGDNHAVFAFAMLGAKVTSCDIAQNQLRNAKAVSDQYEWGQRIEYKCADTMILEGIPDNTYDFVYTSNGVHVWINDLVGMYKNIHRIMKKNGVYIIYDIHPMLRPFDDDLKIIKPYDMTGPFEQNEEVTFAWRIMDIMNAMLNSGLTITHVEEMPDEKDYEWPFWLSLQNLEDGITATKEEVDFRYDWRNNPNMALPSWISVVARVDQ